MSKVYQSTVEFDEDFKEYYVTLPDELLDSLGWEEGDIVEWHTNKDGTVLIERVDEYFEGGEDE